MTYPSSDDSPDPYQPQQPYGPPPDPTAPPGQDPYATPGYPTSGQPAAGYPTSGGQPAPGYPQFPPGGQPAGGYPPPYQGAPQPYYGAPGYGYAVPPTRTNPLAIASLACSLGGLVTCISAPVGIVLGHIAKRQIRETGEQGEGMATAGLWVGYILTMLFILGLLVWLAIVIFAIGHANDSTF